MNSRDMMRLAAVLPFAALLGCTLPRMEDCAFTWQPAMRDSLILPALPHLLGRNWKGEDMWTLNREEITQEYGWDKPGITRLKGGDLELVFMKRVPDLDGADLYVTLEPCWMKVQDAALLSNVISARRLPIAPWRE